MPSGRGGGRARRSDDYHIESTMGEQPMTRHVVVLTVGRMGELRVPEATVMTSGPGAPTIPAMVRLAPRIAIQSRR